MLYDILTSLFVATILIALLASVVYLFFKFPKLFIMVIFVAIILFGIVACPTVAESFVEKEGVITRIAPELFNNYPILVVTVETFDGEIFTYYAEEEIDVQGTITLLLFGEEVIDVY